MNFINDEQGKQTVKNLAPEDFEETFLVGRWKNSGKIFQRSISRKTFQSKVLPPRYLKKIIRIKFC